jgi:hypothetical protein
LFEVEKDSEKEREREREKKRRNTFSGFFVLSLSHFESTLAHSL